MGDESTVGESQLSVASSEMSVAGGGEGGGGEGHDKRKMMLGAVCILLSVGIIAGIGYSQLSTEHVTEPGGDDSGGEKSSGGGGQDSVAGYGYKSGKAASSTTQPKTIKRKGILVCIVGSALSSNEDVDPSFCDYTILSDLSFYDGKVAGTHGSTSWKIFRKLMEVADPKTIPGGSFITAHPENPANPISAASLTPEILKTLTDPPLKMRALGFLGIEYPHRDMASFISYYKVFKTALSNLDKAMTFMGVVITQEQGAYDFAKQIAGVSHLDTIILETHVTQIATGAHPKACTTNYMSYEVGELVRNVPTFKVANTTVAYIRQKTNKFRTMYSFSSGAMLFIGDNATASYGKSCDRALLVSPSVLCDLTNGQNFTIDLTETAAYTFWEKDKRHHFLAAMEQTTTEELMAEYGGQQSEGWALFNIELDHHLKCDLADRVADVETISKIARSRKSNG